MTSLHLSSLSSTFHHSGGCIIYDTRCGLLGTKLSLAVGPTSNLSVVCLGRKSFHNVKGQFRTRAATVSGEGDFLSFASNNDVLGQSGVDVAQPVEIDMQADAVALGALAADTAPTSAGFSEEDDEYELDLPTKGFASIPEAIEDIRQGKIVIVVDDEDRENEGDLVMAAELATPEAMAFFVKHGTGIVCVSMKAEDVERLQLPLMVSSKDNEEKLSTAFTVSVDAKRGTTTGVSAKDRAITVRTLASKDSRPEDFNRPGHMFPLKYREGGILKRAGHTEASVDLAMLAGLNPVGVICEIVDDDGSMARLPRLRYFAQKENIKIVSIADLIRYRRKRDQLVERSSAAEIPTMWGPFTAYCYRSFLDGIEHIAMVKDDGRDTVEANEELGLPVDSREYGIGAQILRDLGVRTMKLMTNNPAKYVGLKGYGLAISGRVPLITPITKENKRYLETKRAKMGHVYGVERSNSTTNLDSNNGKPSMND
ncbi:hypothetical protein RND81_11G158000 [Saponaria officinalis]|uniref:GTP cyclohydrolase II domain-containing protein n=1 Tax=Saponaria officinalis TaxID=3572 RepID=A0AAW1HMP3_SAPOF